MNRTVYRPTGVLLLAIMLLWIGGGGTLFFPIMIFAGVFSNTTWLWNSLLGSVIHSDAGSTAIECVVLTAWYLAYVAYLVIGIGLLKLKNWARKALLVLCGLGIALGPVFAAIFHKQPMLGLAAVCWCGSICGWQAFYLMRPRVRYAFGDWRKYTATGEWTEPPALSKRGKLMVGIALPATTIGVFAILLVFGINAVLRQTTPYQMAMSTAQRSPCVVNALGSPLTAGFVTGNYEENGEEGSAEYNISVKGPKGNGALAVEAKKSDGDWSIESLVLTQNSRDTHIVPAESGSICQ